MHIISKCTMIFLVCFLLTGCYGKAELDDLAYVIALGADVAPSGDSDDIQITYQVAIPIKITGENNQTGTQTYTTYTTVAPSLGIANSQINMIASKKVDLAHVSLIIYSKELAQKGLEGHVNSLVSNVSIRPKTIVSVCEGTAKNFLENVKPVLETSPARYYELLISSFQYTSRSTATDILHFYTASQSNYLAPIAVMVSLNGKNEAKFSGLAAFKGLKMVGEIPEEMVISHSLLSNQLKEAVLKLPYSGMKSPIITTVIKENKAPIIKANVQNSIPQVAIKVFIDAHLESSSGSINFYQKDSSELLNEKIKEKIKKDLEDYLKLTILLNADTVGIGRFAKANYLTLPEFDQINWKKIYPFLKYQIDVESTLNVSQIVSHSIPTFEE